LFAGRPQIVLLTNSITDTNFVTGETYSPKMSSRISNNGKRIAQNLSFRFFLILSDFTFLTPSYPFSVQSEDF